MFGDDIRQHRPMCSVETDEQAAKDTAEKDTAEKDTVENGDRTTMQLKISQRDNFIGEMRVYEYLR